MSESWYSALCSYKSVKFVRVTNKTLVCTYYSLLLLVLLYVIVFSLIIGKGYQGIDYPIGTVTPKVKGVGVVPDEQTDSELYEGTVWTADDMVIPAEANALFVTTRYLITHQNRSTCAGNDDTKECNDRGMTCTKNEIDSEYGIYTGNCLNNSTCEVSGWCPLEEDHEGTMYVDNVGAWTVFFKVNLRFPEFDTDKSNALDKYGSAPTEGYNLFTIDEILEMAGDNLEDVKKKGAILLFSSKFTCNLDKSEDDQCDPEFEVFRIDNAEGTISPGFNYREVRYDHDFDERDLIKRWGIRIIFVIDGEAGKFDWIATAITIGAGLGFFAVATLVTDFIMDSCIEQDYTSLKYTDVLPGMFSSPSVALSRMGRESGEDAVIDVDPVNSDAVRDHAATDPLISRDSEQNADYSAIENKSDDNKIQATNTIVSAASKKNAEHSAIDSEPNENKPDIKDPLLSAISEENADHSAIDTKPDDSKIDAQEI